MKINEINSKRNSKGTVSFSNHIAGWFALSKLGEYHNVHMITYQKGKFTFTKNDDVNKFYTERGFAIRVTQLLKRGY
jgi:hypothetical protein